MRLLIVQRRLPYAPRRLARCGDAFLDEIVKMIAETVPARGEDLELADIGFAPAEHYIEIKLYFREKINMPPQSSP